MDELIISGRELLSTVKGYIRENKIDYQPRHILMCAEDESAPRTMGGKQLEVLLEDRIGLEMPAIGRNSKHVMSVFEKDPGEDPKLLGQLVYYSTKVPA